MITPAQATVLTLLNAWGRCECGSIEFREVAWSDVPWRCNAPKCSRGYSPASPYPAEFYHGRLVPAWFLYPDHVKRP